jgi:hypothetical protein
VVERLLRWLGGVAFLVVALFGMWLLMHMGRMGGIEDVCRGHIDCGVGPSECRAP